MQKAPYRAILLFILLLPAGYASAQSFTKMTGQWVNVNDSSEHLTLSENEEFRLITHDHFNNEDHHYIGRWMYTTNLKKKLFLFPEHLPRQYYVVKRRGMLGYTLNERKGHKVYARRALVAGESLPAAGRGQD